MPVRNTFPKEEHLKSKKLIDQLFAKGRRIREGSLELIWLPAELSIEFPVILGVSVPKKRFQKAADRNRIKRRMREAYRLNKGIVFDAISEGNKCAIMIVYQSGEELSYPDIEMRIIAILKRFINDHENSGKDL
jgi:ribonuclease P protein component